MLTEKCVGGGGKQKVGELYTVHVASKMYFGKENLRNNLY